MRKKTSNKDLAKRAKNLVRKWQAEVMPTASNTPQFNGDKMKSHRLPQHLLKMGSKPASPASRPDTPSSVASSTSPGLPPTSLSPKAGFRPVTGGPLGVKHHSTPTLSFVDNKNNSANSTHKQLLGKNSETRNGHSNSFLCINSSNPSFSGETKQSLSKTDVANKRKRRKDINDCDTPVVKKLLSSSPTVDIVSGKNLSVMNGAAKGSFERRDYNKCELQLNSSTSMKKRASGDNLKLYIDSKQKIDLFSVDSTSSIKSESACKTPIIKTPRVKTTAEIVADLATSGGLNVTDSVAVRKIALNQIDKEIDQDFTPLVPAGAKPRPRRKPKNMAPPQTSEASFHATKKEMVNKFLASAIPHPNSDLDLGSSGSLVRNLSAPSLEDESPSVENHEESGPNYAGGDASGFALSRLSAKDAATTKLLKLVNSKSDLSAPTDTSSTDRVKFTLGDETTEEETKPDILTDPWSLLPPLDDETIDWKSLTYTPAERAKVNEENLERLHTEQWSGVNGLYDHWQNWNDWTRTYSMPSYNGDHLHILPYVVLDDINEEVLPDVSS